jgi:Flp pilus assembly protein TadD
MIGKKKKITKKELQEDKLVSSFYQTQEFVNENKQTLIISLGALAFVIVAIAWYVNKIDSDNKLAATQVSQIISSYDQGQFQKAIDGEPGTQLSGLKSIVEEYGSTDQGEVAKIYLANSYYSLGDYSSALEYYEDYSGQSKLHQATAFAGIAACYEQTGNYNEAANLYKKAATIIKLESQSSDYLLNAGINYIKAGEKLDAKIVLELLKKDYKTSTAAREVDKYLMQL